MFSTDASLKTVFGDLFLNLKTFSEAPELQFHENSQDEFFILLEFFETSILSKLSQKMKNKKSPKSFYDGKMMEKFVEYIDQVRKKNAELKATLTRQNIMLMHMNNSLHNANAVNYATDTQNDYHVLSNRNEKYQSRISKTKNEIENIEKENENLKQKTRVLCYLSRKIVIILRMQTKRKLKLKN